ncbi:hypothetical protein D9615_004229 [Tricholomella constricta]|uniref:Chitin-binding type-3 domain-containing protein n=1 Tax=Tricholomella constricta TaxID=117010 RepID=A0A8H5HEN8_9AGAR|nr:hypothetical protein D9615_004229 [Tricholomella constricta]
MPYRDDNDQEDHDHHIEACIYFDDEDDFHDLNCKDLVHDLEGLIYDPENFIYDLKGHFNGFIYDPYDLKGANGIFDEANDIFDKANDIFDEANDIRSDDSNDDNSNDDSIFPTAHPDFWKLRGYRQLECIQHVRRRKQGCSWAVPYSGRLWTAKWWTQGDNPGGGVGVWSDNGACSSAGGTASNPAPTSNAPAPTSGTGSDSCTGIAAWSSGVTYHGSNKAVYGGRLWTARWWSYADTPGGNAGVWADSGACLSRRRRRRSRLFRY